MRENGTLAPFFVITKKLSLESLVFCLIVWLGRHSSLTLLEDQ